jgi:hypothetical protein
MKKQKTDIKINDLKVFEEIITALNKTVESIKINIDQSGMTILTRNAFARFHVTSNCVESTEPCEMNIQDLTMLIKTLKLINKQCKNMDGLTCYFEHPFMYFKSKDVKTKIITVKERAIQNSLDSAIDMVFDILFEFKTNSKIIKDICTNKFIFDDLESARCYLVWGGDDMHNNTIYTELNNRLNELNSSLTIPLGDITLNKLTEDRDMILDFDRLNAFNMFKTDEDIVIQFTSKNILISELDINKKNGTFIKLKVYNSLRKS